LNKRSACTGRAYDRAFGSRAGRTTVAEDNAVLSTNYYKYNNDQKRRQIDVYKQVGCHIKNEK